MVFILDGLQSQRATGILFKGLEFCLLAPIFRGELDLQETNQFERLNLILFLTVNLNDKFTNVTNEKKQDHRRWRYHRRHLDYQNPYFQFQTSFHISIL